VREGTSHNSAKVIMAIPLSVVIFGASGDLTARKLIPALFHLFQKNRLPAEAQVIGVSRSEYSHDAFRDMMKKKVSEAIKAAGENWSDSKWDDFARKLFYVPTDASTNPGMMVLRDWLAQSENGPARRLYYASVSPELYPQIATHLGNLGMSQEDQGFRRLVIEKPFGHDLPTAKALNWVLQAHFREEQIYRIDHYLGKETVQNILIFRFANTMFEPLWNHQYIDHVQITVSEKVIIGSRGGYYNQFGVLRDMFQSHLLQVMAMVAMEAPARFTADKLRNEKMKVLDAVTIPPAAEADQYVAAGQYEGYLQEPGVPADSRTPTYAAIKLHVDNWRWRNVPFYLRSGKGLASRYSEVMIQFRCPPHLMFPLPPGEILQCNRLTLVLQPNEGIRLNIQTKVPDVEGTMLQPRDMAFDYRGAYPEKALPEAYERLLLDAMQGDAALFMRSDEIERAWEIMDPLIAASEATTSPQPTAYPVGSQGPKCADDLLATEGRTWQPLR